jgi:hypothetical protein
LCDDCTAKFSVESALTCSKGGLVLVCHNDLNKEWGALGAKALSPSAVTYKPTIYSGRPVQREGGEEEDGEGEGPEAGKHTHPKGGRRDVAIHGFWKRGTTSIFDGRVTCLDALSYWKRSPEAVLK